MSAIHNRSWCYSQEGGFDVGESLQDPTFFYSICSVYEIETRTAECHWTASASKEFKLQVGLSANKK